jgi:hypothetical protein
MLDTIGNGLIILIPKFRGKLKIGNWSLITFLGGVHIIMAKIFTQCLQEFLPTIIQPNQTRFIEGRNIIFNLFLTQEAMERARKMGKISGQDLANPIECLFEV